MFSSSTDQQTHPAQNGVGSLHWALSGHVIAWLSFYLWTVNKTNPNAIFVVYIAGRHRNRLLESGALSLRYVSAF